MKYLFKTIPPRYWNRKANAVRKKYIGLLLAMLLLLTGCGTRASNPLPEDSNSSDASLSASEDAGGQSSVAPSVDRQNAVSSWRESLHVSDAAIVATVGGIEITAGEVARERGINQFQNTNESIEVSNPTEEADVVKSLAKKKFLIGLSEELGCAVSSDEVMQQHQASVKSLADRVRAGNQEAIKDQKELERLYSQLGITEEKYFETMGFDILLYGMTYYSYVKFYDKNLYEQYQISSEDYLERRFNEAGYITY